MLLLIPSLQAQTVGGGYETTHRWYGSSGGDTLGVSVDGAGDINADGYADLIAGAPLADSGSGLFLDGEAIAYSGKDGSVLYTWKDGGSLSYFGGAVSDVGDLNNDGYAEVLIGARTDNGNGLTPNGSAFVYSGSSGQLMYSWYGSSDGDKFGAAVSDAGDVNNDGVGDLLVGAPETATGAAQVFGFNPYLASTATTISASAFNLISLDGKVLQSFFGNYGPLMNVDMHGTLDNHGHAVASIGLMPGMVSGLVGRTFYAAAIANEVGHLPGYSSVAIAFEITP